MEKVTFICVVLTVVLKAVDNEELSDSLKV